MLETPRLVLREPESGDATLVHAYTWRNRERFARWEPDPGDEAAYARWIATRRAESAAGTGRTFLAFDRADPGALAGIVNLFGIHRALLQAATLGYTLDGAYEGRGYAREAVAAVIGHAFGELRLHRIVANYQPANERSGNLLRRLGFVVEGYARDLLYLRGAWRDHVMTALHNPAWTPPAP